MKKEDFKKEIRELIKEELFKDKKFVLNDTKLMLSEGLQYHINNNIPLKKNIFRPTSAAFNQLFRETRALWIENKIFVNPDDEFLLKTDIGEIGIFEGFSVPLDLPMSIEDDIVLEKINEAMYKDKKVKLNKPKRNTGSGGKYVVYVRDPKKKGKNKIKRVTFGAKGMSVGIEDPKRVKSFISRHRCKTTTDKTSARWWSCRLPRYAKSLGLKDTGKKWW